MFQRQFLCIQQGPVIVDTLVPAHPVNDRTVRRWRVVYLANSVIIHKRCFHLDKNTKLLNESQELYPATHLVRPSKYLFFYFSLIKFKTDS